MRSVGGGAWLLLAKRAKQAEHNNHAGMPFRGWEESTEAPSELNIAPATYKEDKEVILTGTDPTQTSKRSRLFLAWAEGRKPQARRLSDGKARWCQRLALGSWRQGWKLQKLPGSSSKRKHPPLLKLNMPCLTGLGPFGLFHHHSGQEGSDEAKSHATC